MKVKQFENKSLSHFSYALVSEGEMVVVDPERNPMKYYTYAEEQNARIIAVIETHPHADFVSSHLQIQKQTGARIYVSEKVGADYDYTRFDEGDSFKVGNANLRAINTPGHSPDSITAVATEGEDTVLFTGDTLFIGDVGRPDLRENAGNMKAKRRDLAKDMYHTMQNKYSDLPDDAVVYPAHGAGSLCGKGMSSANSSTLGNERLSNWAFKDMSEEEFIDELLNDQPFIPSYFGFNVDINKEGAENVQWATHKVDLKLYIDAVDDSHAKIVDCRDNDDFTNGHLEGSINIMATSAGQKFETWLGSIIKPGETFYCVIPSVQEYENLLERIARIGYENQLKGILTLSESVSQQSAHLDYEDFKENPSNYNIIDVRNRSEVKSDKKFSDSKNVPLHELRGSADSIDFNKPVVVHCAAGYRSAAGTSILASEHPEATVYDLGERIKDY